MVYTPIISNRENGLTQVQNELCSVLELLVIIRYIFKQKEKDISGTHYYSSVKSMRVGA